MFYWSCALGSTLFIFIRETGVLRTFFIELPRPYHDSIYALLVDDKTKEEDKPSRTLIIFLAALILATLALISLLLFINTIGHARGKEWLGTFGDFFGGVLNPLLTFGTFIGLSITIILQRTQLRDARAEYQKNLDASNVQAFENTFFNMLNLHNSIVDGLRFDPNLLAPNTSVENDMRSYSRMPRASTFAEGRQVFDEIVLCLKPKAGRMKSPVALYRELQTHHNHVLGHYFRNLYQILKLIYAFEKSTLKRKAAHSYASILRAQLSASEVFLLMFNCSQNMVDSGRFKELIIRYRFLEHLPLQFSTVMIDKRPKLSMFGPIEDDLLQQYLEVSYVDQKIRVHTTGAFGNQKAITDYLKFKGLLEDRGAKRPAMHPEDKYAY